MRKIFWLSISTALFLLFAYATFAGILSLFLLYGFYANNMPLENGLTQTWYTASWLIACIPLRQIIMGASRLAESPSTTEKTHLHAQKKEKTARSYTKG